MPTMDRDEVFRMMAARHNETAQMMHKVWGPAKDGTVLPPPIDLTMEQEKEIFLRVYRESGLTEEQIDKELEGIRRNMCHWFESGNSRGA